MQDGQAILSLQSLPLTLLGAIWPAERIVIGRQTCRSMHTGLSEHVHNILLSRPEGRRVNPADLRDDLQRWHDKDVDLRWRVSQEDLNESPRETGFSHFSSLYTAMLSSGFGCALTHLQLQVETVEGEDTGEYPCCTNLPAVLRTCTGLVRLHLSGLGIQGVAVEMATALQHCRELRELDLQHNRIGAEGASGLARSLGSQVTRLALEWNDIGVDGATALSSMLRRCTSLSHLDVRANNCQAVGIAKLAEALEHNSALTSLNVAWNNAREEGATAVARMMGRCPSLRVLDVSRNRVRRGGLRAVCSEVCSEVARSGEAPALQELRLGLNDFGPDGVEELEELVQRCGELVQVDWTCNRLGPDGAERVGELLRSRWEGVEALDLALNGLGDAGVERLARALGCCRALRFLGLRQNGVTDAGALALASGVGAASKLECVDLTANEVTEGGARAVEAARGAACTVLYSARVPVWVA